MRAFIGRNPTFDTCKVGNAGVQIGATGDVLFTGGGGLAFGSCYGSSLTFSQDPAADDTWYNVIDAAIVDGTLHNVAHDGNGKLTVTHAGHYLINWSVCWSNDEANEHVEVGIEIADSGSANAAGRTMNETKFAGKEECCSGTAALDLVAGATVELAIRTTDNTDPGISVHAMNLSLIQIGGT